MCESVTTFALLFYEALGAQHRLEIRHKQAALADEAVKTSLGLFNVGASDKPDLLEIEIEAHEARLAVTTAQNEQLRIWQQLAAVIGVRLDAFSLGRRLRQVHSGSGAGRDVGGNPA